VSRITNEIVYQTDDLGKNPTMIALSIDQINQNIWVHSTKQLFYTDYRDEKKNVWIQYVKKGKLQQAIEFTEGSEHQGLVRGLLAD
jgi:Tol biopolymer transport system component